MRAAGASSRLQVIPRTFRADAVSFSVRRNKSERAVAAFAKTGEVFRLRKWAKHRVTPAVRLQQSPG
jgi:hypothetical protein